MNTFKRFIRSLLGLTNRIENAKNNVKPLLDKYHAVKVRIENSDGSYREITGEEAYKWNEKILMLNYLHLHDVNCEEKINFEEIKWEKGMINEDKSLQ